MKTRSICILLAVITALFMLSTNAFSTPSASIMFQETDIGGGVWQYDYTISNTSDNGEMLYMFLLDFGQAVTLNGSTLPTAWFGTVWEGTNMSSYADAMSVNPVTYIGAGDSLNGFSFTVNSQVDEVPFHAEFLGTSAFNGTTTVVPEPLSSLLFISGSATIALRYRFRKKRV